MGMPKGSAVIISSPSQRLYASPSPCCTYFAMPPASGKRTASRPIIKIIGSVRSPMSTQLSTEAGPAITAVIAGSTMMPAPSTAPVVIAAPETTVRLFLKCTVSSI